MSELGSIALADSQSLTQRIAAARRASVVAPAGYGKTEELSRAACALGGRRLVLTHTHAGVDAIRRRLRLMEPTANSVCVETIAGWCLRYVTAFPVRSSYRLPVDRDDISWDELYRAMQLLITSGAATKLLRASYMSVLIDEYQDCTHLQHSLIKSLADVLPTCIFGDPLQAIFQFAEGRRVEWVDDVESVFPVAERLEEPWRWKRRGRSELGDWLKITRRLIETQEAVDLCHAPCEAVSVCIVDTSDRFSLMKACQKAQGLAQAHESIVIIADSRNLNYRAKLCQQLSKLGFSNIEPIDCETLTSAGEDYESTNGCERLAGALDFASKCIVGTERAALFQAVEKHIVKGKSIPQRFAHVADAAVRVASRGSPEDFLDLLERLRQAPEARGYRWQLFFAMKNALGRWALNPASSLRECVWEAQNFARHAGRSMPRKAIGSTLLVKGLEFDHSIVIAYRGMSKRDFYVAITRGARSLTVISPTQRLTLPP